eukprot:3936-Chlamydomonas_euryale.AAC.1
MCGTERVCDRACVGQGVCGTERVWDRACVGQSVCGTERGQPWRKTSNSGSDTARRPGASHYALFSGAAG